MRKMYEETYIKHTESKNTNNNNIKDKWNKLQTNIAKTTEEVLNKRPTTGNDKKQFNQGYEKTKKLKNMTPVRWINSKREEGKRHYKINETEPTRYVRKKERMVRQKANRQERRDANTN